MSKGCSNHVSPAIYGSILLGELVKLVLAGQLRKGDWRIAAVLGLASRLGVRGHSTGHSPGLGGVCMDQRQLGCHPWWWCCGKNYCSEARQVITCTIIDNRKCARQANNECQ